MDTAFDATNHFCSSNTSSWRIAQSVSPVTPLSVTSTSGADIVHIPFYSRFPLGF
jgi:hypothetical protein